MVRRMRWEEDEDEYLAEVCGKFDWLALAQLACYLWLLTSLAAFLLDCGG